MQLTQGPLLYEGKAKKVYRSDKPETVLIEFKNDATAFNALKIAQIEDKGRVNCQISACIFEMLSDNQVVNHYLGLASDTWMVALRVDVIPVEVVIRNIATGSLCKETPIQDGQKLFPPLLDLYYKDDKLSDPLLTDARLKLLGIVSEERRLEIEKVARDVNKLMCSFFEGIDLILVDF